MTDTVEKPWDGASRLAFALLVLGALASLPWLVHGYHEANVATNDAAIYIVVAKSMLAGDGYTFLERPFTVHPPGMPLVIAAVMALRGLDFYALNFVVSLFGVAMVALLYVLVRPRIGPWLAFLVCVLVWFNPTFRRLSNEVMSDVPGAALVLACLCIERWASRRPSLAREILLGAMIAVAAYMRTVSVLLVPAILLARAFVLISSHPKRSDWIAFVTRRALPFAATAVVLLVPWNVRCARLAPHEIIDQNFVHSYASGMWHADPRDPASPRLPVSAILGRIPVRGEQILGLLGNRLRTKNELFDSTGGNGLVANDEVMTEPAHVAVGAIVVLAAAWILVTKRRASEWFLAANVALVSIYFGFQHRLVLLPFVLCVPLVVELVVDLWRTQAARILCAAVLLLVIAMDFRPREGFENIAARDRLYREFCGDVARRLAPDARLCAAIGWHYSLYLDRPVYSLQFSKLREGDARGAGFVYDKYALNTLICAPFSTAELALLPQCRKLPHCEELVHGGVLVRVRE